MTEEMKEPVAQTTEQEAASQESTDLNISDLNALKMIIDVASSRGTFKPNEMVVVGQTYTKLSNFLEAVAKQQPPKQGA